MNRLLNFAQMIDNIKNSIFLYFEALIPTLEKMISQEILLSEFDEKMKNFAEEFKSKFTILGLDHNHIIQSHCRILFEDNFTILMAYYCINNHYKALSARHSQVTFEHIGNIIEIKDTFISIVINPDYSSELKLLIRDKLLQELVNPNLDEFLMKFYIQTYIQEPPQRVPKSDFTLFSEIINSQVIKEAKFSFIREGLMMENQPYKDLETGIKMLEFAYSHAINAEKTFYSILDMSVHGLSSDEYIFVKKDYKYQANLLITMRAITLLHECAHIYKRIYPGTNFYNISPSINLFINGEWVSKGEDGYRFERILFGETTRRLYQGTACFLAKSKN